MFDVPPDWGDCLATRGREQEESRDDSAFKVISYDLPVGCNPSPTRGEGARCHRGDAEESFEQWHFVKVMGFAGLHPTERQQDRLK